MTMVKTPTTVTSWRMWIVPRTPPSETRGQTYPDHAEMLSAPCLYSPHEMTPWTTRTLTARCPSHACHPFCFCGVYAVDNVVDILFRAGEASRWIWLTNGSLWASGEMAAIVVGRVTVYEPKRYHAFVTEHLEAPEWRGTSATVDELFVPACAGSWDSADLAVALRKRYGVAVSVGDPEITDSDRTAAPPWLRHGMPAPGVFPGGITTINGQVAAAMASDFYWHAAVALATATRKEIP